MRTQQSSYPYVKNLNPKEGQILSLLQLESCRLVLESPHPD